MKYGEIISTSLKITFKNKTLWALAAVSTLLTFVFVTTPLNVGSQYLSQYLRDISSDPTTFLSKLNDTMSPQNFTFAKVAPVLLVVLVIWIVLTIASYVTTGAATFEAAFADAEQPTSFRRGLEVGIRKFWSMLAASIITGLPLILSLVVMYFGTFLIISGAYSLIVNHSSNMSPLVIGLILYVVGSMVMFVAYFISVPWAYFSRGAVVLENMTFGKAIKRGWYLVGKRLGTGILLLIISYVATLVAMIVPTFIQAPISFGMTLATATSFTLGLIGNTISALISVPFTILLIAFINTLWVVAYRRIQAIELQEEQQRLQGVAILQPNPQPEQEPVCLVS